MSSNYSISKSNKGNFIVFDHTRGKMIMSFEDEQDALDYVKGVSELMNVDVTDYLEE